MRVFVALMYRDDFDAKPKIIGVHADAFAAMENAELTYAACRTTGVAKGARLLGWSLGTGSEFASQGVQVIATEEDRTTLSGDELYPLAFEIHVYEVTP